MSESLVPANALPPRHPEQAPDAYDWRNDPQLSEKWKKRFAFYDSLAPATSQWSSLPGAQAALKQLPWRERVLVNSNFFAFFFTFIYVGFFLKLWKQALILFGLGFGLGFIAGMLNMPDAVIRAFGIAIAVFASMRANYWYFLSKAKGKDIGWML